MYVFFSPLPTGSYILGHFAISSRFVSLIFGLARVFALNEPKLLAH